jgi:hypothetical protein
MVIGNLRDQIIYPDSIDDMKMKNVCDRDLMNILEIVNFQHVVIREGGFNCISLCLSRRIIIMVTRGIYLKVLIRSLIGMTCFLVKKYIVNVITFIFKT